MPGGPIGFSTLSGDGQDNTLDRVTVNDALGLLVSGPNAIAAEVHQDRPDSSDISFDLELVGITGAPLSNAPPMVSITSPPNNAVFNFPANINVEADASDPDGSVSRVEFFANGSSIGEDISSPFGTLWSGVGTGNYTLLAIATDNGGRRATSGPVNITVTSIPNDLPTVTITAPVSGRTFNAPTNVFVAASVSDSDGSVVRVEFLRNGVLIGEVRHQLDERFDRHLPADRSGHRQPRWQWHLGASQHHIYRCCPRHFGGFGVGLEILGLGRGFRDGMVCAGF
jgi:hypothetical protein